MTRRPKLYPTRQADKLTGNETGCKEHLKKCSSQAFRKVLVSARLRWEADRRPAAPAGRPSCLRLYVFARRPKNTGPDRGPAGRPGRGPVCDRKRAQRDRRQRPLKTCSSRAFRKVPVSGYFFGKRSVRARLDGPKSKPRSRLGPKRRWGAALPVFPVVSGRHGA